MKPTAFKYYVQSLQVIIKDVCNPLSLAGFIFSTVEKGERLISLHGSERFFVRNLLDVWVIKETLLDKQYEHASVILQPDWSIIDIGAALGDYVVWASGQLTRGRVFAVEPYPQTLELLKKNLQMNHVLNATVIEKAITEISGVTTIQQVGASTVQHSTARMNLSRPGVEVTTITLSELMEECGLDVCDYLKMDCEGAEYDILFNTPPDVLRRIPRICMEVHDGLAPHNRGEMIAYLEDAGYSTKLTSNPVHESLALLYAWNPEIVP